MHHERPRREFLAESLVAGSALVAGPAAAQTAAASDRPVILGGTPLRKLEVSPWPLHDQQEEQNVMRAARSGAWSRADGPQIAQFESQVAAALGAKYCLATSSGTGALLTSLVAAGVEAGDEVLLPSYTFIACANVVLMRYALPVFVDVEPETFQMASQSAQQAVTDRTTAIMPVHIGGAAADMDGFRRLASDRRIPLIEDACQAPLGEWKGTKLGTLGDLGCFSFQASKNVTAGEGGALVTNDEGLFRRCQAFHWHGVSRDRTPPPTTGFVSGCKFTTTEFQAAVLLAQWSRLEEHTRRRNENAAYLSSMLREIPGIVPARMYEGCTRNAWHLYMFRFLSEPFGGLTRTQFLKALAMEGVSASSGYTPLNHDRLVNTTVRSKGFSRLFSAQRLRDWEEQSRTPRSQQLSQEAVWLTQRVLLGTRQDMELIATAIRRIQRHAAELRQS